MHDYIGAHAFVYSMKRLHSDSIQGTLSTSKADKAVFESNLVRFCQLIPFSLKKEKKNLFFCSLINNISLVSVIHFCKLETDTSVNTTWVLAAIFRQASTFLM